jgi:hypothetical protein
MVFPGKVVVLYENGVEFLFVLHDFAFSRPYDASICTWRERQTVLKLDFTFRYQHALSVH